MSLDLLLNISRSLVSSVPQNFRRSAWDRVNFEQRLVVLRGARGVGKTTMLLQHLADRPSNSRDALYASADNIQVEALGVFNLATQFSNLGGRLLVLDEIHKYRNWTQEIKNIYDSFPNLRLIISGSSALDLTKGAADLSRRAVTYDVHELSFREYLALEGGPVLPAYKLEEILSRHLEIAHSIPSDLPVLKYFCDFLSCGAYPYYREGRTEYPHKVLAAIDKVLYEDIPALSGLRPDNVRYLKLLLQMIASSPPFTIEPNHLSLALGISKEYLYRYLQHLEEAGLVRQLITKSSGLKHRRKAGKAFLRNSNLLYAINFGTRLETISGTVREHFFLQQVSTQMGVYADAGVDFLLENGARVEIGGKQKKLGHYRHLDTTGLYLAVDNLPLGVGPKIPLYLFGLLY
jgi:uncharacterized protein